MPLSDDDKRRIEEEEYRKHVQSQLRDTQRVDVNLKTDQRVETHGVGREMYRDAKREISGAIDFYWDLLKKTIIMLIVVGIVVMVVQGFIDGW